MYFTTYVVPLFLFYIQKCDSLEIKEGALRQKVVNRNMQMCVELGKDPYFDIDIIVGRPWRIYYVWNINMGSKCVDMNFKNSTSWTVNRFYNDMYEYMETNPNWDGATVLLTMGSGQNELLLFVNQGPAGSFDGVPNVVKTGNLKPNRKAVPLLKFFMKLIQHDKYLLVFDCHIGVASLLSRQRPQKKDLEEVVKKLNIGEGTAVCDLDNRRK